MRSVTLEPFVEGFVYLEGLRTHRGSLWMSDMVGGAVHRISEDGAHQRIIDVPGRPSGLGFLPDGTPLVVSMVDRKVYRILDGELQVHADLSALASADLNDMLVDAEGRAYVGGFGYDFFAGAAASPTDVFVIEPDGNAKSAARGLAFPNGMVLIDKGRTLVVAETWVGRLTAYERGPGGVLTNGRVYAELGALTPDGICVDAEDGIWVASFATGEFVRVAAGGSTITDRIDVGGSIAITCALGGADGRTLYCSSYAGSAQDALSGKALGHVGIAKVNIGTAGTTHLPLTTKSYPKVWASAFDD